MGRRAIELRTGVILTELYYTLEFRMPFEKTTELYLPTCLLPYLPTYLLTRLQATNFPTYIGGVMKRQAIFGR